MIAMGNPVADRNVVATYLVTDKDDREKQRAQFIHCFNLRTQNPFEAVEIMRLNDLYGETDHPAYHIAVAFPVSDALKLDEERMRQVARYLMNDLRCGAHQAVLVAHEDRRHPHFHLLLERRNPETQLLWATPLYRRLHIAARRAEREFGLKETPSHLAKLPDQQWPSRSKTVPLGARRARWRTMERIKEELALAGEPRGKLQVLHLHPDEDALIKKARAKLSPYFDYMQRIPFDEFTKDMANFGYELRPAPSHEKGVVFYSPAADAAIAGSYVAPNASYYGLRNLFGEELDEYLARRRADLSGLYATLGERARGGRKPGRDRRERGGDGPERRPAKPSRARTRGDAVGGVGERTGERAGGRAVVLNNGRRVRGLADPLPPSSVDGLADGSFRIGFLLGERERESTEVLLRFEHERLRRERDALGRGARGLAGAADEPAGRHQRDPEGVVLRDGGPAARSERDPGDAPAGVWHDDEALHGDDPRGGDGLSGHDSRLLAADRAGRSGDQANTEDREPRAEDAARDHERIAAGHDEDGGLRGGRRDELGDRHGGEREIHSGAALQGGAEDQPAIRTDAQDVARGRHAPEQQRDGSGALDAPAGLDADRAAAGSDLRGGGSDPRVQEGGRADARGDAPDHGLEGHRGEANAPHVDALSEPEEPRFLAHHHQGFFPQVMDEHAFESYRMESVERAEEVAAWANQHWKTAPDATILRLKVLDQVDRENSRIPSRLDLMDIHPEVKAYKAALAEAAARAAAAQPKAPEKTSVLDSRLKMPERKRPAPAPVAAPPTPLEILEQRVRERGEYQRMIAEIGTLKEKERQITTSLDEVRAMDQRIHGYSLTRTLEPLYGADAASVARKIAHIHEEKGLFPVIVALDKKPGEFGTVVPESRPSRWRSGPAVSSVAERVQQIVRSMRAHDSARLQKERALIMLRVTLLTPETTPEGIVQAATTQLSTIGARARQLDYKADYHPGHTLDEVQNAYKALNPADRETAHRTIQALGSLLPVAPKAPLSGPAPDISPAPKEKGSRGFSL